MVIATIPARYAAPQTARMLSITLSSVLNPTLHFRSDSFLFTVFIIRIRAANSTVLYSLHFLYLFILHKARHRLCIAGRFSCNSSCIFATAYRASASCRNADLPSKKAHISAGFPPFASRCRFSDACHLAYFSNAPSFRALVSAKTGESPKGLPPVLSIPRQKFVKYRHKRSRYTTISYSPMPPDEK